MKAANAFAPTINAITMEMTVVGKSLTWLTNKVGFNCTESLWGVASKYYAQGARGTATTFINPVKVRVQNIWITTERTMLRVNGVHCQYKLNYLLCLDGYLKKNL